MGIDLELYRKTVNSPDRVYTGKKDINGMKIKVGDVLVPVGSNEQYFVNYSADKNCYYGLGRDNKIINQKKFSKCENVGVAIFNHDARRIFG